MAELSKVALIGNPNCGKTTLFNALAGQNRKTGNWAGVTVSRTEAKLIRNNTQFSLIDLPGLYGLSLTELTQDEQVVKQAIDHGDIDLFINVLNANNLQRGLFLTTEILEQDVPTILVLNMDDERASSGKQIDTQALVAATGCPVLTTTATKHQGVNELFDAIATTLNNPASPQHQHTMLPADIELPTAENRAAALRAYLSKCDDVLGTNQRIFDARFKQSVALAEQVVKVSQPISSNSETATFNRIDQWLTSPVTGTLGFVLAMYLMFFFAINVANVFIDFFDITAGAIFIKRHQPVVGNCQRPRLADGDPGRRGRRRHPNRGHFHPGDWLFVFVFDLAGRIWLHGQGRFCDE